MCAGDILGLDAAMACGSPAAIVLMLSVSFCALKAATLTVALRPAAGLLLLLVAKRWLAGDRAKNPPSGSMWGDGSWV